MSGTKANTQSRDAIRTQIFSAKPESELITFFGVEIELRQPPLGQMLDARATSPDEAGLLMLTNYAYVPGTDERVFEPADEESIRALPMGPDIQRLTDSVNRLLGMDVEGLENRVKDAMKSASNGASSGNDDGSSSGAGEE